MNRWLLSGRGRASSARLALGAPSTTARSTARVRSARRKSGTRHSESEASRRRSPATRTKATCPSSAGGPPPPRLQPSRHRLGGAIRRRKRHAPAAARRRALAPPPGRPVRTPQRPGRDPRHPRAGDGPDEICVAAYGLLNKATGVETTEDSVFQIGSMTKVWTATVVMQLVTREARSRRADPRRAARAEPRGSGRGRTPHHAPSARPHERHRRRRLHRHGAATTASNATSSYSPRLRSHPLEATWSVLQPRVRPRRTGDREADGRDVGRRDQGAAGRAARTDAHRHPPRGGAPVPRRGRPRQRGRRRARARTRVDIAAVTRPAGLVNSTAADVLAFARMHLSGGRRPTAPESSARARPGDAEHQVDLPDKYTLGDSWGIGWIRFGWDGQRLVGHDGNTSARPRSCGCCPTRPRVTLLTNGGNARASSTRISTARSSASSQASRCRARSSLRVTWFRSTSRPRLGTYEREGAPTWRCSQAPRAGAAHDRDRAHRRARRQADPRVPMVAVAEDLFVVRDPGLPDVDGDDPSTTCPRANGILHFGVRATPRTNRGTRRRVPLRTRRVFVRDHERR